MAKRMYYTMFSSDGTGVHVHHSEDYCNKYFYSIPGEARVKHPRVSPLNYNQKRDDLHPNVTGLRKLAASGWVDHLLVHVMKYDPNFGGVGDKLMEDRVERVDIGSNIEVALERAAKIVGVSDGSLLPSDRTLIPLDVKGKLVPDAKIETPGIHWMFSPRFSGEVTFVDVNIDGAKFTNAEGVTVLMTLEELSQAVPRMVNGVLSGTFAYVRVGAGFGIEFASTMKVEEEKKDGGTKAKGKLREWDQ